MNQRPETQFVVGDRVRVLPDEKSGRVMKILPSNGRRPTEYHVRPFSGSLTKTYWRAKQLEKIGQQERLEA